MEINSNISGEQVAYDGNLSTEILLRLPIQSILRSKCVSKLWLSLITNPSFSLLYAKRQLNPNSPSGLFLERRSYLAHQEYDFAPFNVENPVRPPFKTLSFDKEASISGISVLQSVNGLMLCHSMCVSLRKYNLVYNPKYYVYNPTLNQFTTLPKFDGWISRSIRGMSLVFDPLISTHFRVVCVRIIESSHNDYYQIDFYSSETGKWRVSGKPISYELDTEFMGGVYWNDSVHWLRKDASVSYLNLHEERIDHIPAPNNGSNFERICNRLLKSQDSLLLIDVFDPRSSQFGVFEMKRDYSGWLLKYKVDLLNVSQAFPEMHPHGYIFAVRCLVLGKKEEDSFVLIEIPGKAIRYNLKLKTFYKLCDFALPPAGNEVSDGDVALIFGRWPGVFLFSESLSVVPHINNTWGL